MALGTKASAMHFSIDAWMVGLFAVDMPTPPDWPWISARVLRCEAQILTTAIELHRIGVSSVLDIALLRADRRREIADTLKSANVAMQFHLLDVSATERWRRVSARNQDKGETFHLAVSRGMFDFIETLWQLPTQDELAVWERAGPVVKAGASH